MTEQPMPHPGGEPVTPAAREWFAQASLQQHDKGLGKYPTELLTDGVDAMEHLGQELVDAIHYYTKERLWKAEVMGALSRWLKARDFPWRSDMPGQLESDCSELQEATDALEHVARKVVG